MVTDPIWEIPPWPGHRSLDLSVIFGTFNRFEILRRTVDCVRRSVGALTYEMVVCDGGSTDGSRQWLAKQEDVVLIGDWRLDGAVAAFNMAFLLSRGSYIANLNDDCHPLEDCYVKGIEELDADPNVGQVAFEHVDRGNWGVNLVHQPEWFYANFGIIREDLVRRIAAIQGGFWNPMYRTYGADTELSCWVHRLGSTVKPLWGVRVEDVLAKDELRKVNHDQGRAERDGKLFWSRWHIPGMMLPGGVVPEVTKEELRRLKRFGHPAEQEALKGVD